MLSIIGRWRAKIWGWIGDNDLFQRTSTGFLLAYYRIAASAGVIFAAVILGSFFLALSSPLIGVDHSILLILYVFLLGAFAFSICIAIAALLITFLRFVLWAQSIVWAGWRLYTAPFHYHKADAIETEEFRYPPEHKRKMTEHVNNREVRKRVLYNSTLGVSFTYLLFLLFSLITVGIAEQYGQNIGAIVEQIIGESVYTVGMFLVDFLSELITEIGVFSFIISQLRSALQDDLSLGILMAGALLSSIYVRNLLHFGELKLQEDGFKADIIVVILGLVTTVLMRVI